ncbi:MAG: type II toxin-antitoxin system RelE/ParE family toxin [Alphaproteobacteria bacterium]|uniref:Type II toxin-antitoxin system RelE/ParE family toxin n=1 Tax=Peteryoungia algae TaxID=2919917 RepID=A0ABT0D4J6_9HYPH|nr:type II toxin-antitoxin system RelE/ParE family toxin [Rhizobium sp. SSM4.3]MBU2329057.1 type II toxin-antitoxin system RelE/ParE family toxin [Alphaproteobacteria bacterium]MCJ8240324.1 type II toxin-antitoxin system RelE/ParE family toxin [Rhizobium sp. SSM4.3]
MISIRLSRRASDYMRRESAYLLGRHPSAARTFVQSMNRARALLREFPDIGNQTHGLQIAGFRTLVVGDYLIDYRRLGDLIEIANIRHGRMHIPVPDADDDP